MSGEWGALFKTLGRHILRPVTRYWRALVVSDKQMPRVVHSRVPRYGTTYLH